MQSEKGEGKMSFLNKFISVMLILVMLLLIQVVGLVFYQVYRTSKGKDCFERIATKECEERGLVFSSLSSRLDALLFECKEDEREIRGREFEFLKEEEEECLK